jgi:hypothetical protein
MRTAVEHKTYGFLSGRVGDGRSGKLRFAAGVFAWFYGMPVLLTLVQAPSSMRMALTSN